MIYKNFFRDVPVAQVPPNQQQTSLPRSQQYVSGGLETIQIGSGDTVFNVDKQGMWLGSRKFDTAPFRVSIAGIPRFTAVDSTGWNPTNVTPDKDYDADATSTAELADVLGTLIARLIACGVISA